MATKDYNFYSEDNKEKWSHLLAQPLKKITYQVHPTLITEDNALFYLERLLYRLLLRLVISLPKTMLDVSYIVMNTFPSPLADWALQEAEATVNSSRIMSKRVPINIPVDKIGSQIAKEFYCMSKLDNKVIIYLLTVIDYMAADILKLAGNFVKNSGRSRIFESDIRVSMNADQALMSLFSKDMDPKTISTSISSLTDSFPTNGLETSFTDAMKEMVSLEGQYIRVLQKIHRILAEPFQSKEPRVFPIEIVEDIFGCLDGVVDLSLSIHGSLQDALEVARAEEDQELSVAAAGTVFNEHSSAYDFEEYNNYARNYETMVQTLETQFKQPWVHNYFKEYFKSNFNCSEGEISTYICTFRYLLPKLLLEPVRHMAYYLLEMLPTMLKICPSASERQEFKDALDGMSKFQTIAEGLIKYEKLPADSLSIDSYILNRRARSKSSFQEIKDIQDKIEGDTKDLMRCSQVIKIGDLNLYQGGYKKGNKPQERRVFLFDCLLLCCKLSSRKDIAEYKLREKFDLKKIHILDTPDSEDTSHGFEMLDSKGIKLYIQASSQELKEEWLSAICYALTQESLESRLEDLLIKERNSIQFQLPSPDIYKFSEPDSDKNIVFEEAGENLLNIRNPPIRAATFTKLVERLTYHKFADPALVKTFLTTYRSFATPTDLMSSLIERYNIPALEEGDNSDVMWSHEAIEQSEKLRRYKKEYLNPIKLRVLNVIRHWIEHHPYDFERDPSLRDQLIRFLETTGEDRRMQKWVETIRRILNNETSIFCSFNNTPPPIEYIGEGPPELPQGVPPGCNLFSYHPVEIARQMTLIQSEYFRAVKVNELIGGAFTKGNKEEKAPNMMRLTNHFNNMSYFFQLSIVQMPNLEERVAVVNRIIDTMQACVELNNFCGMMIIMTAFNTSSINKLDHTWSQVSKSRMGLVEAQRDTSKDHTYKLLKSKLFTIEPPCVPHIGMFLTRIIHVECGMKDTLSEFQNMINFTKRRRFCDIVGEIQQYQNQRFNMSVEKSIQEFLLAQTPKDGSDADEVETLIHKLSIEIEPRDQPPPKISRQYPHLNLHSQGYKATRVRSAIKRTGGMHPSESAVSLENLLDTPTTITKSRTLQAITSSNQMLEGSNSKHNGNATDEHIVSESFASVEELGAKPPKIPPRINRKEVSPVTYSANTFPRPSSVHNVEPLPPRLPEHSFRQPTQNSLAPPLPPRKQTGDAIEIPPPRPSKPLNLSNSQISKHEFKTADV